jgi:hypothetical protein
MLLRSLCVSAYVLQIQMSRMKLLALAGSTDTKQAADNIAAGRRTHVRPRRR